ncbi:hypothetical protein LSTR_LSTR005607, partial [Laodelphax striatellus]
VPAEPIVERGRWGFGGGERKELDLDYLERRDGSRPVRPSSMAETSPDSVDLVKVIILGAPGVGKTSIIQQFVWNDFSDDYESTDRKHTYYPSVIINDRLYELKIFDLPAIPYFPVNSFYEWTDFRFYGLRSATAYLLVFDLNDTETFQYVSRLRDQISESRDVSEILFLVVGNKEDLLTEHNDCDTFETRKAIANLVRRHWMCGYVECSAKHNWRVVDVFKELMKMIDQAQMNGRLLRAASYSSSSDNDQAGRGGGSVASTQDRTRCSIL